ncbi:MAG TPA: hypothetical protein PKZ36_02425 [Candidatus Paceibacterota bacterium]|nr:hypothetical protein [Candidatus Paceibacterota bacterium]HPT18237.1 hypothetical protein [Candidatus Paceibacterota bacterium]
MNSKVKNIIIFSVIGLALILGYFIFANKKSSDESLISSSDKEASTTTENTNTSSTNEVGEDFIAILLNVKNLKLDDSILSDTAFSYLKDSSIYLIPEGNEGRTNPFAPIGSDTVSSVISNPTGIVSTMDVTEKADSSSSTEKNTDNTVVNTKIDTTKQN